jgi:hypothetical protein
MALHWDMTKVIEADILQNEENWDTTTHIIFMMLHTGTNKLTVDTIDEAWARYDMVSRIHDFTMARDRETFWRYLGLSTNVTNETRNQWLKRFVGGTMDNTISDLKNDRRIAEKRLAEALTK